jgi:hypothetical protein
VETVAEHEATVEAAVERRAAVEAAVTDKYGVGRHPPPSSHGYEESWTAARRRGSGRGDRAEG